MKRKTSGHKIPDIYMAKDEDGTTSGQQLFTKAGTTALALTGSDADLVFSGTMAQIIMSGASGTINMSGATPAIVGAIQHRNTKAGTVAISLSGSDADIELSGTNAQIIMSGNANAITMSGTSAVLDMTGVTPSIAGAIQMRTSKAGTVAVDISGSDADLQLTGSNAQIIMSGDTPTLNMSGAGGLLTGTMQVVTNRAGTVAVNISGSDADLQITGTNSQIIMSGNASGIRLEGTGAKFYFANDLGQVGTFDFTGSSVRMYFGGGTGTFV